MTELEKLEVQGLQSEILNLQTLRFTVLGIAATAIGAYMAWITTAAATLAAANASILLYLILTAAVLVTAHFGSLISRAATYLLVFYDSPWQKRLAELRDREHPMHIGTRLALVYAFLAIGSSVATHITCKHPSAFEDKVLAWFTAIAFLAALLQLATSHCGLKNDRTRWQSLKDNGTTGGGGKGPVSTQ